MANQDELPSQIEEYTRLAPEYDSRWRRYVQDTIREVIRELPPSIDTPLLDVGCGTGHLLSHLLPLSNPDLLAGIDPTPSMVTMARSRLPDAIDLREGRAENLPWPAGSFSWVVSTSSLHCFQDPRGSLQEFHRVLQPGGHLLLSDWCGQSMGIRWLVRWLRFRQAAPVRLFRDAELNQLLQECGFTPIAFRRFTAARWWPLYLVTARRDAPMA